MISVPPVALSGQGGSPDGIRGLATGLASRDTDLSARGAHVRAAAAVLEGNHGKHVAQLRERLDPLPSRYEALGKAYKTVAGILDDYADSLALLQGEAAQMQRQVDDDTYRLAIARESCLASDPTFPGHALPWDVVPSPYVAPNLAYLGHWNNALDDLMRSRDSLANLPSRRQSLDETTARRLRDVTVDGPGVKDWLHKLAPAGAIGWDGFKLTLKSLNVKKFLALRKELAKAAGIADDAPEAYEAVKAELTDVVTGRGLPGEWVLNKTGLIRSSGLLKVLTPVGRVLGPIGAVYAIGSGVRHAISPSYDGMRGTVDRIVGGVGAIGGATSIAIMAGALSATGVGAIVVLGAAVVVGAWALGNAIYDHWDDIRGFTSRAWKSTSKVVGRVNDTIIGAQDAAINAALHPVASLKKAGSFVKGLFS